MDDTNNNTNVRNTLIIMSVVIILIIVGYLGKYLILGGANYSKTTSAALLVGQVAQSLDISNGKTVSISATNNFTLQNTKYFDNSTWVVTKVIPLNNQANNGIVVMQKVGQFYQSVLGPGSSFPSSAVQGLPTDVQQYLNSLGLVYDASN